MQINSALNLVFPIRYIEVEKPDPQDPKKTITTLEPSAYAYHTPLSRETFEANYRIIAATQVALSGKGQIGLRIASLALKDAAIQDALEQGQVPPADLNSIPLIAEIARLTQVIAPTPQGYFPMPAVNAISTRMIDAEEWSEAESALVFFTCAYALVPRIAKEGVMTRLALTMRGSTTLLTPTGYAASLATSTTVATSEPSVPAMEVPPATRPEHPQ